MHAGDSQVTTQNGDLINGRLTDLTNIVGYENTQAYSVLYRRTMDE